MFRHLLTRLRLAYLQLKIRWTQDEIDVITEMLRALPIEREHFQRHRLGLCREVSVLRAQAAAAALERRFRRPPCRAALSTGGVLARMACRARQIGPGAPTGRPHAPLGQLAQRALQEPAIRNPH